MGGYDMGDYPGAEEHFVPLNFTFNSNAHRAIVIHKTGGDATPDAVHSTFLASGLLPDTDPKHKRSAHYAVGQDGTIWQFVSETRGAGANGIPDSSMEPFWKEFRQTFGNLNLCTLSIEHCDPKLDNSTPLTAEQKKASFDLVAHLARKYNIPASNIKPHRSICVTGCPGTYPMEELIQFIQTGGNEDMLQISDPFAAAHFTQITDNRWHCITTNTDVALGILDFYRHIGGAPRLPLTGERHDPDHNVTYQAFEAGVIVFDPDHKFDNPTGFKSCYLLKLDSELAKKLLG